MKSLIVFGLAFFVSIHLNAQTTVSGTVKNFKSHVIRGANISVKTHYDGKTSEI